MYGYTLPIQKICIWFFVWNVTNDLSVDAPEYLNLWLTGVKYNLFVHPSSGLYS